MTAAGTDLVCAAYVEAAEAWTAQPEKTIPDPDLASRALASARRTDDPVLISAALDAVVVRLDHGGRIREAHQRAGQRPARWLGSAGYGMVLAHGLRGDDKGRRQWLDRVGELGGDHPELVSGTYLAAAAAFTEARIRLHQGRIDAAVAAVAGLRPEDEAW
jgi:hypothetical protein